MGDSRMSERDFSEILNECIDRLAGGQSVEDCAAIYPQHATQLQSLLGIGLHVRHAQAPPQEVQRVHSALRDQVHMAALRARQQRPVTKRPVWRNLALLAATLVMLFATSLIFAQESLPGDALYPVKRFGETLQSGFNPASAEDFMKRRVDEVNALIAQGRSATVTFQGEVDAIEDYVWHIWGWRVVANETLPQVDSVQVGATLDVTAQLAANGMLYVEAFTVLLPPPIMSITPEPSPTWTFTPSSSPEPSSTLTLTTTTTATAAITVTASPTVSETPTQPPPTPAACQAPDGWQAYTIRGGDTLSGLAGASGSSIAEIMAVNCLENHFIVVGQVLYLPRSVNVGQPDYNPGFPYEWGQGGDESSRSDSDSDSRSDS